MIGEEYSNISLSGIALESTPIKRKPQQASFTEYVTVNETTVNNNSTILPTNEKVQNQQQQSSKDSDELDSIIDTHPELKIASRENGEFNPVNVAYTMFTPQKQQNPEIILTPLNKPLQQQESKDKDLTTTSNQQVQNILLNPMTPYTLTLYFQLFSNMIMASIVIYMTYLAYTTIRQDINFKIQRMTLDLLDEISQCLKQYTLNKCHLSTRPPAIEQECNYLDKCQNQDPSLISRSNLTSEILAEIINSFFNKLNYKSISIVLIFLVINLVSNYYIIGNFQYNEINRLKKLESNSNPESKLDTKIDLD